MKTGNTPMLIGPPLSKEESMRLKVGSGISVGVIMIISRFDHVGSRELMVLEKNDQNKKRFKFINGNMEEADRDLLSAAKKILDKKLGYLSSPKEDNIFFAGEFSSTKKDERHFKVFVIIDDYNPGYSIPKEERDVLWMPFNGVKWKLTKTHQYCFESYKDRVKLIELEETNKQNPMSDV